MYMKKSISVFILLCCLSVKAFSQLTVSGSATVKVIPDEVIILLGVESENDVLEKAKEENDRVIKQVLKFANDQGVDSKNIQTDYVRIYPYVDYGPTGDPLKGVKKFKAYQSLSVTLKDLKKYDALITGLVKLGINTIQDVNFKTSDLTKYREQARTLALQAAKDKAQKMAKDLGITLGSIKKVDEDTSDLGFPPIPLGGRYNMMDNKMAMEASQGAAGNDPTLAPGQISVKAYVSLSYEIK
jgi:uncharacterized protein